MSQILQIIKDIVTTIAAGIAAIVAIMGIKAWKKQLKGKTNYELARRYLRAVYKVRDAIKYVRNPFISSEEIFSAFKESGLNEVDYNNQQKSNRAVYSLRWKKVIEAISDLDVELLEAEVLWGKEVVELKESLNLCINELFFNLKRFLEEGNRREFHDVIYDVDNGIFTKKVNEAVEKIETYIKPHLK